MISININFEDAEIVLQRDHFDIVFLIVCPRRKKIIDYIVFTKTFILGVRSLRTSISQNFSHISSNGHLNNSYVHSVS